MRAYSKVILIILLLVFFSYSVLAQIPEYSINIDLKNKSVEIGESMLSIFHLRGGGLCEDHYIILDTEGIMEFDSKIPVLSYTINESDPKKLELEVIRESCIQEGEVISYATKKFDTAGTMRIRLPSGFFKSEFIDLESRIILKPLDDSQPGEYDMKATFFCLNRDKWYNFNDEESFKVFLKGEKKQFVTAKALSWWAIGVASFSAIIAFFSLFLQWWTPKSLDEKTRITNVFRRLRYHLKNFFKFKKEQQPPQQR